MSNHPGPEPLSRPTRPEPGGPAAARPALPADDARDAAALERAIADDDGERTTATDLRAELDT